jgi:hypothetical protein
MVYINYAHMYEKNKDTYECTYHVYVTACKLAQYQE